MFGFPKSEASRHVNQNIMVWGPCVTVDCCTTDRLWVVRADSETLIQIDYRCQSRKLSLWVWFGSNRLMYDSVIESCKLATHLHSAINSMFQILHRIDEPFMNTYNDVITCYNVARAMHCIPEIQIMSRSIQYRNYLTDARQDDCEVWEDDMSWRLYKHNDKL